MLEFFLANTFPDIAVDKRNSLKLLLDLWAKDCLVNDPALQLAANHSFDLGPHPRFSFKLDWIFGESVLGKNPDATIADLLEIATAKKLKILDQKFPYSLVSHLLNESSLGVREFPLKWSFVVKSFHTDGVEKIALVTAHWRDITQAPVPGSEPTCKMSGFRPSDDQRVKDLPLKNATIINSVFLFYKWADLTLETEIGDEVLPEDEQEPVVE